MMRFVGTLSLVLFLTPAVARADDSRFNVEDIRDWLGFCTKLSTEGSKPIPSPSRRICEFISGEGWGCIIGVSNRDSIFKTDKVMIIKALNNILENRWFFHEEYFVGNTTLSEAKSLLGSSPPPTIEQVKKINRLLIEKSFPQEISGARAGVRPEVGALCDSLKGQAYWLRIDVITIQYFLNQIDATNIFTDHQVYYRASVGEGLNSLRQTQSQDPNDFAESVKLQSPKSGPRVRLLKKGARVVIKEIEPYQDEVKVYFFDAGGSQAAIYLKMQEKNAIKAVHFWRGP